MKNTASTFCQYLENKKISGHEKLRGFIVMQGRLHLQFSIFPTITEWLAICHEWHSTFEQNMNFLHIKKI